uniref:WSN domain-containing protein n=2 Tax=Caenorhabditis japonica TaxID=281687 RepID=A0A8R1I3N5_CAEJA
MEVERLTYYECIARQKMRRCVTTTKITKSIRSLNHVKYKALKCQNFNFSVIFIGAVMLMPSFGCAQLNNKRRLDLDGFRNITEQTATIARLMNALYLQTHLKLEAVTMEDVITEVLDVPNSFLFYTINERDIRDTVNDMKAFDLLTTIPIEERVINFYGLLLNETLSKMLTAPNLWAFSMVGMGFFEASDFASQTVLKLKTLMDASSNQAYRNNIYVMQTFFQDFANSTVNMVQSFKIFRDSYKATLYTFTLVRLQIEEVKSLIPILKAFQQVADKQYLISLINKLNSLKLYTPILESWVNVSYRERISRQASVMHDLLRKSDKKFDEKILIGLPNGSRDLAALSQDFKKEWLRKLLHDGKSLNELETLLTPMQKFEKQLVLIEKVWHMPARNEYLNCVQKFLKSLQGLDALNSTNISQALPNAISALDKLSSNTKYVNEIVDEFDHFVKSWDELLTSFESGQNYFNGKKGDTYFFYKIDDIISAYNSKEAEQIQLRYIEDLPYLDYLKDLNLTLTTLVSLSQNYREIKTSITNITNFWKKFDEFSLTFQMAYNSDVEEVINVLRVIKTIVPFTKNERSNIAGLTEFLLAAKAKLSESKKLDDVLQQEMKHVGLNRMISFFNARDIASQFAHYHRTLVFYQKPELSQFFHSFRSNGLKLVRKIDDLPPNEKRAMRQIWHWTPQKNETEDELTIKKFLTAVVDAEEFVNTNIGPKGNLTSLAKVLIKLNGIMIPAFQYKTMRASIEAWKITSLGQSEEVSNAERSLAQLEGVYSSLAHEKYQIGGMLEDADRVFKSFFTEQPPEDWTIVLLTTAMVAYVLIFIAVVILCCILKWKFKIADVKQQK